MFAVYSYESDVAPTIATLSRYHWYEEASSATIESVMLLPFCTLYSSSRSVVISGAEAGAVAVTAQTLEGASPIELEAIQYMYSVPAAVAVYE